LIYAVFPRTTGAPSATTITDTNYVNRVIFDGADSDELTVDLPYLSEKPMVRTDGQTTWAGLIVQSPLRAPPSTAQTIDVVVTCRVKPGSVWASMGDWAGGEGQFIAPAVVQMAGPDATPVGKIGGAGHEYITSFVAGENVRSFRQLIKMLDRFLTSAQKASGDWMGTIGSADVFPFDFESAFLASNNVQPGRGISSRFNLIAAMFGNWTGSMVLEFTTGNYCDIEIGYGGNTYTWLSPYSPTNRNTTISKTALKVGSANVNNNVKVTVPYFSQYLCNMVIFNYNTAAGYNPTRSAGTPATAGNDVPFLTVHVSDTGLSAFCCPTVFRRAGDDFGFSWYLGMPPYVSATNPTSSPFIDAVDSFVATN